MPILISRSLLERVHRVAHAQRRGERAVGRRERRHHRVADGLDHRAGLRRDDLVQHAEVLAHQIVGDDVADPLVKLGRALEVGEQERQARDLQPLIDVERVGAIDVAERLVGQQPLGGQERPPLAEQVVQRDGRRSTATAARARRCGCRAPAAAGPAASRWSWSANAPCCRSATAFCRSLVGSPLTSMKCAACVTGSNTMTNSAGNCTEICAFSPGPSSIESMVISSRICSRPVSGRSMPVPQKVWRKYSHTGSVMRIVRRDPPHARAHGEGDLDHLVERRLVGLRAQRAVVGLLVHRLELLAGVEHAAAARAQHVPVQLEQAEPRGVQEGADDLFFVRARAWRRTPAR